MPRKRKTPGNRSERRGHWTPGKPRHKPADDLVSEIRTLLELHSSGSRPRKGEPRISIRGIAEEVGVSDRTVRRWLGLTEDGTQDNPAADHKRRLRGWLKRVRRQLGDEGTVVTD